VTAGSSSLSYDATTDQYVYVWKTDKAWANTCRQLMVTLDDGSVHTAEFKFFNRRHGTTWARWVSAHLRPRSARLADLPTTGLTGQQVLALNIAIERLGERDGGAGVGAADLVTNERNSLQMQRVPSLRSPGRFTRLPNASDR
jgi:hypothetical protein